MQEKQKFNDDLLDSIFRSLIAFLFMTVSSIVLIYLIIRELIQIFN